MNPVLFLPEDWSYYRYEGSFTTLPCTEGVVWFVMKTPVEASTEVIATIRATIGPNNRPVQPVNGRVIEE